MYGQECVCLYVCPKGRYGNKGLVLCGQIGEDSAGIRVERRCANEMKAKDVQVCW